MRASRLAGARRGGNDAAVGLGHAAASWSSGCCELTVRTVLASVGRVPGEEQVGARRDTVGEGGVHLVRVRVRVESQVRVRVRVRSSELGLGLAMRCVKAASTVALLVTTAMLSCGLWLRKVRAAVVASARKCSSCRPPA